MHIPRYWTRAAIDEQGREVAPTTATPFVAFGWSDESPEAAYQQALRVAMERRQQVLDDPEHWVDLDESDWYYQCGGRLREQIVEEDSHQGWAITSNRYGALVLNTERVMILDFDDDDPRFKPQGGGGLFGWLLGKKPSAEGPTMLDRIREAAAEHRDLGIRLYRTAGGYRGIVTNRTYDPTGAAADDLMDAFPVDELYTQLCKGQKCYRARLTPKPWRCGMPLPPAAYPFRSEREESAYTHWVARYEQATGELGVCELVETLGSGAMAEGVGPIIDVHDRHALAASGQRLA